MKSKCVINLLFLNKFLKRLHMKMTLIEVIKLSFKTECTYILAFTYMYIKGNHSRILEFYMHKQHKKDKKENILLII